jgi:hypothetical protein
MSDSCFGPRSGGAPGFPKRTIQVWGKGIVLLNRTTRQYRQFRLHDPLAGNRLRASARPEIRLQTMWTLRAGREKL